MKTRLSITLFIISLLLVSCGEKFPTINYDVTGSWKISKIDTKSIQIGSETIEIYVNFSGDNTFQLFQMAGEGRYHLYTGTWQRENNILSGTYSDNTTWACNYLIYIDDERKTLTLTADNKTKETMVFFVCNIPQSIIDNAIKVN